MCQVINLEWIALASLLALSCSVATAETAGARNGDIRVLIVDGFSNHDWKQTTKLATRILEDSGLFAVDVSTAPTSKESPEWTAWRPRFADYDAVIQNCNSLGGRGAWPTEVQRSLEQFVAGGGGLYILHSGNNAFAEWEEYNRMIGLGWRNRNFGWAITVSDDGTVVRVPPGEGGNTGHGKRIDAVLSRLGDHPIHRGLPRQWRAADLEVYRYARGPAENLTVLSYAQDPQTKLNFPIEWTVAYGKGRVYNSTFGHVWKGDANPPAARCAAFQTLLVRAVEWVATGNVTSPVPADFPGPDAVRLR